MRHSLRMVITVIPIATVYSTLGQHGGTLLEATSNGVRKSKIEKAQVVSGPAVRRTGAKDEKIRAVSESAVRRVGVQVTAEGEANVAPTIKVAANASEERAIGGLLEFDKEKEKKKEERVQRTSIFHQHVDWPIFQSPVDLKRSPQWSAYLTSVYGTSVMNPEHYPIDLSHFWILYESHLNSSGLAQLLLRNGEHKKGCPMEEGDLYWVMSGGIGHGGEFGKDPAGTAWIYHRPPYQGLPRDAWVEVSHVKVPSEDNGFWMYWAPGSGVFYHLGETEVFGLHRDANKKHTRGEISDTIIVEALPGNITAKSFQFLQHGDMRCGNTAVEILDLKHAGSSPCMDGLAAGWAADCTCICNADQVATSCTPDCSALDVSLLQTPETHERVFLYAALVIAIAAAFFLRLAFNTSRPSYILLSSLCSVFFGSENFVNAYAGEYLWNPEAHIKMTFIVTGLLTVSLHTVLKTTCPSYKSDWEFTCASSPRALVLIIAAGIFICCAQFCANLGFNRDSSNSGPNQAMVCLNAIPVSVFFYFYAGEALSRGQLYGFLAVIVGTLIMSGISHWTIVNLEPMILLSMLFYGGSIIVLRLAAEMGMPVRPTMVIVNFVTGLIGLLMFFIVAADGRLIGGFLEYQERPALLVWPLLNATAGIFGIWTTVYAYGAPEALTGLITAIIDSNSVPMTLMNLRVRGLIPNFDKSLGMVVIVVGIIALSMIESHSATSASKECNTK
jgi:hypothetical protein